MAGFVYDGDANRLQQVDLTGATPITTTYTNDVLGLSQVLVSSNGLTTTHNLFGLDLIHVDDGSATRTVLGDGLGSGRVEMVGSAVETATTYEPYGKVLAQSGASGTVYGFTGEQLVSYAKAGRLPSGLLSQESLSNRHKEGKQMAVMKQIATAAGLYPQEPPTATSLTGAPSHTGNEWHDINWRKVNQNVRRLQARIVKATQAGRWGKVKALQRLLTRSFSGKALAVRRVTENQGKRTAGVDGAYSGVWRSPNPIHGDQVFRGMAIRYSDDGDHP